jgi:hypothetical protein
MRYQEPKTGGDIPRKPEMLEALQAVVTACCNLTPAERSRVLHTAGILLSVPEKE